MGFFLFLGKIFNYKSGTFYLGLSKWVQVNCQGTRTNAEGDGGEGLLEIKWHPTKLLHGKMSCAEDQHKLWGSGEGVEPDF